MTDTVFILYHFKAIYIKLLMRIPLFLWNSFIFVYTNFTICVGTIHIQKVKRTTFEYHEGHQLI